MSVRERRGEAPRPKAPSPPLSPSRKPGSPLYAGLSAINKYKAGIEVLPENVLLAVAGAIACAAETEAKNITIRIEAVEKEHLGDYGLWRVRILNELDPTKSKIPMVLMKREIVRSWHGPVPVETIVVKHGMRDYEIATRLELSNGPNKLWRALFLASRALFLLGLRETTKDGESRGLI